MKQLFFLAGFFLIGVLVFSPLAAQDSLGWNIDDVFDSPTPVEETEGDADDSEVLSSIVRRGVTFDLSFEFQAGIAPGFDDAPWYSTDEVSWSPGGKIRTNFGIDAQISEIFRIKNTFYFEIPSTSSLFRFELGELFFDYNFYNKVFFRGGKYNLSWGISPNYGFTNLLSRVPNDEYAGDSYLLKADFPVGIGGFQALVLTRANLMGSTGIDRNDFGYGGKYNLAFQWADFNLGVYYKNGMPLRSFLSVKTTLGNTELYSEGLVAININQLSDCSGAANIGFAQDFFDGDFSVNGELFYNAEKESSWFRPETTIRESGNVPFVEGINLALNLVYRLGGWGSPRLYLLTRYSPVQNSAQLIPAFRLSPLSHIEVYLAVPMALGDKDGYYYRNNEDIKNPSRPFSVMLFVTLKGDIKVGSYF